MQKLIDDICILLRQSLFTLDCVYLFVTDLRMRVSCVIAILHHLSKSDSEAFLRLISAVALYTSAASASLSSEVKSGPKTSSILSLITPDALKHVNKSLMLPVRITEKIFGPLR